ncbi:related to YSR3-dihydrosphingosine-1-phosphate phosphatase [Serendipita indica DSM 11827]|uniref:Related to YSR3-dihydrosphingosine-1-phosphate phosphatase n=1 Tax=Serendipita indica (strain DSM 11827) TaxID=1109443 RepID=G4TP40_SERID|nr:related to YSR3-dihydrosphingosine-1-phosphate phosphatase [Serendipita indica DSM 11827]
MCARVLRSTAVKRLSQFGVERRSTTLRMASKTAHSVHQISPASSVERISEKGGPVETVQEVQRPGRTLRKSRSGEQRFSLDDFEEHTEMEDLREHEDTGDDSPGTLPDAVYNAQLSWWRSATRRALKRSLKHESRILGKIQRAVRTRFLDSYFLYSSALGSHTFFMSALPALFYFGYGETGRGLLQIMCIGVYVSSFMKDCFCSPRPFVPLVSRLTIGTHHLEYGFPSTHSTNSVSFAVYLYLLLRTDAANAGSTFASPLPYALAVAGILWYAASIVLGRLYCGMHSFTDCIVGTALGAVIGGIQGVYGPVIEDTVANSNWILPVAAALLCLLLTNQHPQPVDDCPCFEDAIAALALLTGTVMSRWHAAQYGWDVPSGFYVSRTPGWENITWMDTITWWLFAILKMVSGVSAIFAWRLMVKQIMHTVLPPVFRWMSGLVGNIGLQLPNRRWYTPATEYESVPREGLHPIPSAMNLPAELSQQAGFGVFGDERDAKTTGRLPHAHLYNGVERNVKWRKGNGTEKHSTHELVDSKGEKLEMYDDDDDTESERDDDIKHYDADVLTKVIVYSGIGVIATYLTPLTFEILGWGVQPVV